MATQFDMGLLGDIFGGGGETGLEGYLTPAQQQAMSRQALLQAAMAIGQASGPSTTPRSLMQILSSGVAAGQQGYAEAQKNAITNLLTRQKLDEAKRTQDLRNMLMKGIGGVTSPAPAPTAEPQTQFPMAGETISPFQSQMIPGLPVGPTVDRASLIGQQMPEGVAPPSLPTVTATAAPRTQQDIFAGLTRDQRLIAALDPNAILPKLFEESMKRESFETITGQDAAEYGLDPKGKYQINNRTNQITTLQAPGDEYKIVSGAQAVKAGLPGVGSYQLNTKTNQATLLGTAEGPFGGSTTGLAYNILLTKDPSSAEYALAYRELDKPVPTERVRADGSVEVVYTKPAPIPSSFAKPSFKGRMPTPTPTPATVVQPDAAVTSTQTRAAPAAVAPADGAVVAPLAAGVKSTPFAPQPEEIKLTRKAINAGVDFVSALDKLESMVRSQGMQVGGIGAVAAGQEVVYEDLLTKIRLAAELGVLNKEDLPRIQAQLGSPTALATYIKGLGSPDAFYSQIGQLRNTAVEEITRKNLQFGQPIMQLPKTFTAGQPAPARPQTPQPILNLLNKYPPRKQ